MYNKSKLKTKWCRILNQHEQQKILTYYRLAGTHDALYIFIDIILHIHLYFHMCTYKREMIDERVSE